MLLQLATPTPFTVESLRRNVEDAAPKMLASVLLFFVFWLVAWTGRRLIAYAAPRVNADTSVVLLLSRLYYYSVLVFGLITALGTAGLDVRALVAGLGLTGFALGFAFKDVLSNFVSGVMLLAYRPFHLGDLIEMGEFVGTIETIRIRDTLLRAHDGRLIIIPNSKLITEVVVNHSDAARSNRTAVPPPLAEPKTTLNASQPKQAPRHTGGSDDEEDSLVVAPAPPPAHANEQP